ncbi:MAG: GSCFA domain-containing protein [Prevotella sp.]|jgi:hypothetical protein
MDFRTIVDIKPSPWKIEPCERMLFVGSCFADNMGKRFQVEKFRAMVNPYGVMYNPASILHTVQRLLEDNSMPFEPNKGGTVVFTLGTNHVYILKETGEIVDNCRKRPQRLFEERELSIDQCAHYLEQAVNLIHSRFPLVRFILTVSPIRYRKYGYHGSRLSKATLLLAIEKVMSNTEVSYFPSYEIMNDELRDYRFYKEDMLHPSDQAVDYIYQRMAETFFSSSTFDFLKAWKPIREALAHRPFNPEGEEYKAFLAKAKEREIALLQPYIEK